MGRDNHRQVKCCKRADHQKESAQGQRRCSPIRNQNLERGIDAPGRVKYTIDNRAGHQGEEDAEGHHDQSVVGLEAIQDERLPTPFAIAGLGRLHRALRAQLEGKRTVHPLTAKGGRY